MCCRNVVAQSTDPDLSWDTVELYVNPSAMPAAPSNWTYAATATGQQRTQRTLRVCSEALSAGGPWYIGLRNLEPVTISYSLRVEMPST